jgi:hypothetical protein
MAISREAILPAALITAAILAHAFITQPPRYQFLLINGGNVIRADSQTGLAIVCERDYRPNGDAFYDCLQRVPPSSPATPPK